MIDDNYVGKCVAGLQYQHVEVLQHVPPFHGY
jgi:hypothetical protein